MNKIIFSINRRILFFGLLFCSLLIKGQNGGFRLIDSVQIHTALKAGFFEQIHSQKTIAYYWHPYEPKSDSLYFFIYDNTKSSIIWHKIPTLFNDNYSPHFSLALNNNKLLLLAPYHFYVLKKTKDYFRVTKTVKLKHNMNVDQIYFLDSNTVFLSGTYNYANRKTLWSKYNFYWYDLNKNKYIHHETIDVGRAITLCYFPLQTVTSTKKYTAISYITKPLVLLYSQKHKLIRTIKLPDFQYNSDSILTKYLSDSILRVYRFHPKNKIEIINNYKLYQYPMIKRISFINEDTLMCVVNTDFNDFKNRRKVYFYSIKQDSIVKIFSIDRHNKNNPRTFFLTSGTVQFNNNVVSFVKETLNNDDVKFKLFLYKYDDNVNADVELEKDTIRVENEKVRKDSIIEMTLKNVLNFTCDYNGNAPDKDSIRTYHSVLFADQYLCKSCFLGYRDRKILIIDNTAQSMELRFKKQLYYQALFPKAIVLFLKNGVSFSKKRLNRISYLKTTE